MRGGEALVAALGAGPAEDLLRETETCLPVPAKGRRPGEEMASRRRLLPVIARRTARPAKPPPRLGRAGEGTP